jgi:putative transposase
MPRPLRIEYEGALYHVMSRGDRREAIFLEDADRDGFLRTLGEACAKTAWQVHAYCLMSNHFHLVVETPRPNLALGMKWLLGTYTQRFNRRHKHWAIFSEVDTKPNRLTGAVKITCVGRATTCISIRYELG